MCVYSLGFNNGEAIKVFLNKKTKILRLLISDAKGNRSLLGYGQ